MIKYLTLVFFLIFSVAFNHSLEEGVSSSPSPQGDTRMGADAATSGTDVTDKEIQAQQEKGQMSQDQEPPKKEEIQEEKVDQSIQ